MRNLRWVLAFVMLGLTPSLAVAVDPKPGDNAIPDPEWLRTKLMTIRDQHHLPSLAAALVVDGKIVAASAVGVRKWGSPEGVTRDDSYHLGSVAKPITATMVARMVEQKKIQWDTTIGQMFPELGFGDIGDCSSVVAHVHDRMHPLAEILVG